MHAHERRVGVCTPTVHAAAGLRSVRAGGWGGGDRIAVGDEGKLSKTSAV